MYTLTGLKCGTVRFEPALGTIVSEKVIRTSTVTDNPIESGSSVADHVFRQPRNIQLQGVVADGEAALDTLDAMWKKGDVLSYTGRTHLENLVIQNLQTNHDASNRNGFDFTATLKQITLGSSEDSGTATTMAGQDGAKTSKSHKTAATKADGLKTTVSTTISSSAYATYVNSYNSKPASSSGPTSRATPSSSGRR